MSDFVNALYWIAMSPWIIIAAVFGWAVLLISIGSIWEAFTK